jgi:hypothetical protein
MLLDGFLGPHLYHKKITVTSVQPRNGRLLALHTLDCDERDQQQKRDSLLRYGINYSCKKIYDAIPWCQFNLSDSIYGQEGVMLGACANMFYIYILFTFVFQVSPVFLSAT